MFKKISGDSLLAIGGAYLFVSFGVFLLLVNFGFGRNSELQGLSNFEMGQYYFNQDDDPNGPYDLTRARHYYELAVAEEPMSEPWLWYQYGRIDFLEGKFTDALEKFAKQREYFGDTVPQVYYMEALTYGYKARSEGNEEDWRLAEENFAKFIAYTPASSWPRVDLAWVYFAQGKFTEMKPVLEEGLFSEPRNPWLLNMYGLALLNSDNNKAEALNFFRLAEAEAGGLTPEEWGMVYPGNDPALWPLGLAEFQETIRNNVELVQ